MYFNAGTFPHECMFSTPGIPAFTGWALSVSWGRIQPQKLLLSSCNYLDHNFKQRCFFLCLHRSLCPLRQEWRGILILKNILRCISNLRCPLGITFLDKVCQSLIPFFCFSAGDYVWLLLGQAVNIGLCLHSLT